MTARHSSYNQSRSLDDAQKYNRDRFESRKMTRLDHVEKQFAEEVVGLVGPEGTIVDLPCGAGRFTPIFSRVNRVYGYDICENMIEVARKQYPDANVTFAIGDAANIPLDDDSADAVFCMRLFHHIEKSSDRLKILRELARVSRNWVAVSFYRTSIHHHKRILLGKKIHGFPIPLKVFLNEAAQTGLHPHKVIRNVFMKTNQTLVLFHK